MPSGGHPVRPSSPRQIPGGFEHSKTDTTNNLPTPESDTDGTDDGCSPAAQDAEEPEGNNHHNYYHSYHNYTNK